MDVVKQYQDAFGFTAKPGNSSNFAGSLVEVMNTMYLGEKGHIAIRTNKIEAAVSELEKKRYKLREDTEKYKGERLNTIYLESQ